MHDNRIDLIIIGLSLVALLLMGTMVFTGCSTHEASFKCTSECAKGTLECEYNSNRLTTDIQ